MSKVEKLVVTLELLAFDIDLQNFSVFPLLYLSFLLMISMLKCLVDFKLKIFEWFGFGKYKLGCFICRRLG